MTGTINIKKITTAASGSAVKLKLLTGPLWKALTFSPAEDTISYKKSLCLSIDKTGLSAAYGSRVLSRVKIRGLKRYTFAGTDYPQPEDAASSAAMAASELGAGSADISLSIPKAWAIIKIVELPLTVMENIEDVISYELDRLTPLSPEDALYDFRIISSAKGKLCVQIIAVKAEILSPYITALKEKGLVLSALTVNLSCMNTLCRYIDRKTDYLFIEINETSFEGALFIENSISNIYSGNLTAGDDRVNAVSILSTTGPLIDILKKQGKPAKVMLLLNNKSSTLKELLKVQIDMPVRILNETDTTFNLQLPGEDSYLAAIGGVLEALWPGHKGINLLEKGRHKKTKAPVVFTLMLMLAVAAVLAIYTAAPIWIEGGKLKEIEAQIALRKEETRKVELLKKEIASLEEEASALENFKKNRPMALNIIKELTPIFPNTAWLNRIKLTETTAEFEGYAASATEILPKIEASKYLKKAEFSSPTFWDARMKANRFIMKAEIENSSAPAVEKPKNEKK